MSPQKASLPAKQTGRAIGALTPKDAKLWEEVAPGTFDRIMSEVEREEEHRRSEDRRMHRLRIGEAWIRVLGHVCGLTTVGTFALLAKHFVDQGAPVQGAWIICTGAVSIVGVFITGRVVQAMGRRPSDPV